MNGGIMPPAMGMPETQSGVNSYGLASSTGGGPPDPTWQTTNYNPPNQQQQQLRGLPSNQKGSKAASNRRVW